ncbi:MAG TPA: PIG-L deacetylase family protein [Actinomycetota bacterium]|jgi:LmbE family N-acetylglucosaminyl deacetylase|nr:PIG-L deacetylase family protein [Actinomycetota bacterium]
MRFATALVLFAHPDDAEYMCGGTVALWAREGTEVHYVCITDGSAGNNEPGAVREEIAKVRKQEQRDAAAVLGVKTVTFLDFADGMLEVTLDARRAVAREVRRIRPDVLVAPDPARLWSAARSYINHADHRAAGELALCAVMPDAPSRPQFPELLDDGFEPYEIPSLWLGAEEPDTYIDITKTIDVKLEALTRHRSQQGEASAPWVRERGRQLGEAGGVEYAEGFRTFVLKEEE